MLGSYDVAVVGAGICGLAHALAAARLGKSVVVVDRDAHANGASIRNFGFITVTGQQQGERVPQDGDVQAEQQTEDVGQGSVGMRVVDAGGTDGLLQSIVGGVAGLFFGG